MYKRRGMFLLPVGSIARRGDVLQEVSMSVGRRSVPGGIATAAAAA